MGEAAGVSVWCEDEAGPYQTKPYAATSWQPEGQPQQQPHEYVRNGTAHIITLFHPASGQVHLTGVLHTTNVILHCWLEQELTTILAQLTEPDPCVEPTTVRASWQHWQEQISASGPPLPPLRLILVLDNLVGHKTPAFVQWLFQHGILPLYTPVVGSWLNMAESMQRILKNRALDGTYPESVAEIVQAFVDVATHWNRQPTPFVWAGKRNARRDRAAVRRHHLAASGASLARPSRVVLYVAGRAT